MPLSMTRSIAILGGIAPLVIAPPRRPAFMSDSDSDDCGRGESLFSSKSQAVAASAQASYEALHRILDGISEAPPQSSEGFSGFSASVEAPPQSSDGFSGFSASVEAPPQASPATPSPPRASHAPPAMAAQKLSCRTGLRCFAHYELMRNCSICRPAPSTAPTAVPTTAPEAASQWLPQDSPVPTTAPEAASQWLPQDSKALPAMLQQHREDDAHARTASGASGTVAQGSAPIAMSMSVPLQWSQAILS